MLMALNIALHGLHLTVILLNMLGWTAKRLRIPSLICQSITLACWAGFGVIKGWWGFCPLTYWHWQVLDNLGKKDLPSNYVSYVAWNWFHIGMDSEFAAGLVLGCFSMAVIINLYLLRRKA